MTTTTDEWANDRGFRTMKYWQWRACEQFGLPWPWPEDWHDSILRSYTNFRNQETGAYLFVIAETGSTTPACLIQITPLYWGIGVSVGDGYLSWRVGPIAVKFQYGPMTWVKNFKKGFDTP